MSESIPELERIMRDLKTFTNQACQTELGDDNEHVSDMCNDAYLMLEQAREQLLAKQKNGE